MKNTLSSNQTNLLNSHLSSLSTSLNDFITLRYLDARGKLGNNFSQFELKVSTIVEKEVMNKIETKNQEIYNEIDKNLLKEYKNLVNLIRLRLSEIQVIYYDTKEKEYQDF